MLVLLKLHTGLAIRNLAACSVFRLESRAAHYMLLELQVEPRFGAAKKGPHPELDPKPLSKSMRRVSSELELAGEQFTNLGAAHVSLQGLQLANFQYCRTINARQKGAGAMSCESPEIREPEFKGLGIPG